MMRKKYVFNKDLPRDYFKVQLKQFFDGTKIPSFSEHFARFLKEFEDKPQENERFEHAAKNQGILWHFAK